MSFTHCTAHKLEPAVLATIIHQRSIEKYKKSQSFLNKTFQQFGSLKNARWLASRDHALSKIERNYSTPAIHQEKIAESNDKNPATAKSHVKDLKFVWFVFFLLFMMDYVSKLRAISLVFQKDDLLVCSINCISESRIDVFELMKTQPGKNYKSLLDNIKEEDDVMYKTTKLN